MGDIVEWTGGWYVYDTPFCSYTTDRKGKIMRVFLKPDAQEINTENLNVYIHDNGIEFY